MNDDTLIRIVAPHFVAGLTARDGHVNKTADILRYMIGWNGPQVASYCAQKGWTWQRVNTTNQAALRSKISPRHPQMETRPAPARARPRPPS